MSVSTFPSAVPDVNNQINELNQTVNNDLTNNEKLLEQQNILKDVLDDEKQNLQDKVDVYDKISETGKRDALLKKNSSQRLKQHNYMFFIIIFAIALLISLELIEKYYSYIFPEWLLTFLRIIIIAVTIIWCFTINEQIQYRDNLNYDRIDLEKPKIDTPEEIERKRRKAAKDGDLLGSIDTTCRIGSENCGTGTTWDSERMLCMPTPTVNENFDTILPNEPCCNYNPI